MMNSESGFPKIQSKKTEQRHFECEGLSSCLNKCLFVLEMGFKIVECLDMKEMLG